MTNTIIINKYQKNNLFIVTIINSDNKITKLLDRETLKILIKKLDTYEIQFVDKSIFTIIDDYISNILCLN